MLERNKRAAADHKWSLQGLLIGNGWISPREQYEAYVKYAYEKNLIQKGSQVAARLEAQLRICQKQMAIGADSIDTSSCESILQDLLEQTIVKEDGVRKCTNMYDVRLKDTYPSCGMNWPPDLVHVTPYLRRPDVTAALHVSPNKTTGWTECDGAVGAAFRTTQAKPSVHLLPDLLKEVRIVLFSGAEDLICNHLGTEALISNMAWGDGRGFELTPGTWAPRRDWTFEGEPAGFWQEARNLTYVLFYNSSHMVPFDVSRQSRDMLDRFMGVDISSIGGQPTDSRLDGEKGPETTVGGAAGNSTTDLQAEKAKLDAAKWEAYRKSGEIVLVIVVVAAAAWGYYVWRDRKNRSGYEGIAGGEGGLASVAASGGRAREGFRNKRTDRDVEAAAAYDENELDDLHVRTPVDAGHDARYSVGGASDDEDSEAEAEKGRRGNGQSSGK